MDGRVNIFRDISDYMEILLGLNMNEAYKYHVSPQYIREEPQIKPFLDLRY